MILQGLGPELQIHLRLIPGDPYAVQNTLGTYGPVVVLLFDLRKSLRLRDTYPGAGCYQKK